MTTAIAPTTPEQCRAQTCDCPPGSCAFPLCIDCDAPLLADEAACCRACEEKHLTAGAAT